MAGPARVRERMRPGAVCVAWHDSAEAAFARLRGEDLDAIPVINGQQVIGLLERTAAHAAQQHGNWLGAVPAASLMRRGAFTCRAEDSIEHALATMDRLEVDLLAVLDEAGRIAGLVGRDQLAGLVPHTFVMARRRAG